MRKFMFLTTVAVLGLTSCSNDEMRDVNRGRAIDFRAETASRATESTAANLQNFYATAYNGNAVYDGFAEELFTKTDGYFYSVTNHFWPENENQVLSFIAYAPATTANGGVLNGDLKLTHSGLTLTGFAPRYDISKQIDFVHATATGSKKANEKIGVGLVFNHALTQIEIKAKNGGFNKYTIAGVKIVGAFNGADYDMAKGWATTGKNKGSYKITYDTNPIVLQATSSEVSLMGDAGTAMLVPQQLTAWDTKDENNTAGGAYLAIKLNLKDADGKLLFPKDDFEDAYGWVAVPIDTKWEAGKKYIYTLDFSTGAGVVAPSTGGDNKFDPGLPGDENDKDHPKNDDDPNNDDGDEDEKNPGGTGEEAPVPGDSVIETPIRFSVTVTNWTTDNQNPNMGL